MRRIGVFAVVSVASLILAAGPAPSGATAPSDPVLYGVIGDGANSYPETLWTIDTSDASMEMVMDLGNGDDGEEIAFNPDSGLLLHASGNGSTQILEFIDPVSEAITPIVSSGDEIREVQV